MAEKSSFFGKLIDALKSLSTKYEKAWDLFKN
jgi:hypothetical protein